MTDKEKGIVRTALLNYIIAIQDDLTQTEHTQEEVSEAFNTWNMAEKLVKKFSK